MELWQLRTFCEIADTLNFTKASEKLNLTQSAVSHQIKALEEELGVKLFIRAKRGVILTEEGKVAVEHAKKILANAELMREEIAGREKAIVGRVRVAAATQALVYLFAPLFENFMDEFENVELVFRTTSSTEQTIDDILNGVADIGFASTSVYSPLLEQTELFKDELLVVVGKKHPLYGAKEVSVKELTDQKWILFEHGASVRRTTDDFFRKVGVKPEKALESNDTYFVKLMIERGQGVALLPNWTVNDERVSGKLNVMRIKGHRIERTVGMTMLKGPYSSPIKVFIRSMLDQKEALRKAAGM